MASGLFAEPTAVVNLWIQSRTIAPLKHQTNIYPKNYVKVLDHHLCSPHPGFDLFHYNSYSLTFLSL